MTIDDGFKLEDCFNRMDKCTKTEQKRAINTVAMACRPLEDNKDKYRACAEPILRLAAVAYDDISALMQEASDTTEKQRETLALTASREDLATVMTNVANVPFGKLYRIDVFAVDGQAELQQKVIDAINSDGTIGDPRRRDITQEDCLKRFLISPHVQATIRYDDVSDERAKKNKLAVLLRDQLRLDVKETAVINPTPFYLSIFLCKQP